MKLNEKIINKKLNIIVSSTKNNNKIASIILKSKKKERKMNNLLTFKVEIEGLENKIWRKIEIPERRTLADLAYTILATFDLLAYHLFKIRYKGHEFVSGFHPENFDNEFSSAKAIDFKLRDLRIKENDTMEMKYDFGSTTTFKITYLGSKELSIYDEYLYPLIIDGSGHGMLDDISSYELQEIIEDIDKKGYSVHSVTPGYGKDEIYDYRDFDIDTNNEKLKGKILQIKNNYEVED